MDAVDAIESGEPPEHPTKVLQASLASDHKPVPAAASAPSIVPAPSIITAPGVATAPSAAPAPHITPAPMGPTMGRTRRPRPN